MGLHCRLTKDDLITQFKIFWLIPLSYPPNLPNQRTRGVAHQFLPGSLQIFILQIQILIRTHKKKRGTYAVSQLCCLLALQLGHVGLGMYLLFKHFLNKIVQNDCCLAANECIFIVNNSGDNEFIGEVKTKQEQKSLMTSTNPFTPFRGTFILLLLYVSSQILSPLKHI